MPVRQYTATTKNTTCCFGDNIHSSTIRVVRVEAKGCP
jgi:hypothetical protein